MLQFAGAKCRPAALQSVRHFSKISLAPPTAVANSMLKPRVPARFFARGPAKAGSRFSQPRKAPTQVLERERETDQQQQYQELQRQQQAGLRMEEEEKYATSGETPYQAISGSEGLQQHLAGVYGILGGTMGIAALGSVAMMTTPLGAIPAVVPAIGGLVPLVGLMFTNPHTHSAALRGTLLGTFGFMSGMAMAPLLGMATAIDPMIVPSALMATTGMFGVMSAGAMMLPKGRLLSMGGPLFAGVIGLVGVGVAGYFVGPASPWYPVLHSVKLYGGLGIFSLYIAYDTQMMIADYEMGNKDKIMAATNMFINLKIIFQQMIMIFIGRSD